MLSFTMSFQLRDKIKKVRDTDASVSKSTDTVQEAAQDDEPEQEGDGDIPEGSAEQLDPHTEEATPVIEPPRSRASLTVPRTTASTTTTTTTTTLSTTLSAGASEVAQNLLQVLAGRAVDSDSLKKKIESVLAEGERPFHAERIHWGQWMAACTNQVCETDWPEFTRITHDLMNRFVRRPIAGGPSQPSSMPVSVPHTSGYQPRSSGMYGYQGQHQQHSGQYGQSYGQSGYGQQYGQPSYVPSSQGQSYAPQPSTPTGAQSAGNLLDISSPVIPSVDSSTAFPSSYSPSFLTDLYSGNAPSSQANQQDASGSGAGAGGSGSCSNTSSQQ